MDNVSFIPQLLTQGAFPRLAPKARIQTDKVSGEPVLLYPEGVLLLNETGAEIIKLCNGKHTFVQIVATLAERYQVSPEQLRDDVSEYIVRLHEHSLVELCTVETHSEVRT